MCVEISVIAPTNGSARRNASTGYGKRTGVSALAAKVPRNPVWKRKKRNRPKKKICEKRRTQTSRRMTGRAGMPEPGRLAFGFMKRFQNGGFATTAATFGVAGTTGVVGTAATDVIGSERRGFGVGTTNGNAVA